MKPARRASGEIDPFGHRPSLTYAIGDIHGRLDLLERAVGIVARHAAGRAHRVVCLGDYIDRGPDSRGVVTLLKKRAVAEGWICLKGNHEALMVEAMLGGDMGLWLDNGGWATLDSYGGLGGVPDSHVTWMASLPLSHQLGGQDGGRLFVHAGVRPDTPMKWQDANTMLWVRDLFLAARPDALPCHVVHGHTPVWRGKPKMEEAERLPHRTNLDTGACWTGVLSIGVFIDGEAGGPSEVLAVRGPEG